MKFEGKNQEYLEIIDIDGNLGNFLEHSKNSELSLVWFYDDGNKIRIDTVDYHFDKNDIVCLTEFHRIKVCKLGKAKLIRWNRPFYCIVDHDSEVGCKGVLYYGSSNVPMLRPEKEELEILQVVMKMFLIELGFKDHLQFEMLQSMLKRFLILCTRIYKSMNSAGMLDHSGVELIREYNFLVEQHFRSKHTVNEYAELLNKSPKTLSNLFKKASGTSPLKFIHNRIILEARRVLIYSEVPVSELAYDLGFADVQVFSRFFKKQEGISPQNFRLREKMTT
ncbi:helix-turn-helix domain-containing protein [Aureibacter tunicatorum]|uniref:AraC-like DNA-binding protein n=1 Tax=Aureibacter tunicatorum TaxID=866807 RepID=A0AAE3XQC3_9BACT|nr:helix-turn-helix domain-containing protein [Aureibacter tunicatorum]MDR6240680.1 AraC-like DNA-binding protein [Aureibacter tunicatorum]BDD06987.1 transcriptional regulator [Aureibacter tunicatorum]